MSAVNETLKDLQARAEQTRDELKASVEKLEKALRGAATRVENSGKQWFEELVKTGEKLKQQQQKATTKASKKAAAEASRLEQLVNRGVAALGLPTRDDVAALEKKLAAMQRKLTKLEKSSAA
ncbi:MAG: poly(hydroxyalkanoate) granule-associated protein [Gammaproteobacteria bacterium HGW-Gammaproteobacteria-14]|nr:MAG: poly(hydroxyalkanoate) granule-associated protein [Gammaproteobacteria bacterium HGW-Gammaproteobacteria-14]